MNEELDKYFLGELSVAEKESLFNQIDSDKSLKQEFIRMQNTIVLSGMCAQRGDMKLVDEMKRQLNSKIKRKHTRRTLWSMSKYAAIILLVLINGWLIWNQDTAAPEEIQHTQIEVPKGQRIFMTLMDGTQAWLSPRSVLKISNQFNKEARVVELDGEGFFAVAKDTDKPFIVKTGKHDIKVLGTRFNVFAYSQSERFETDLLDGSVEVSYTAGTGQSLILRPGERAAMVNNQLVKSTSYFNNEEYLKTGIFSFSNKPFTEVLEYLSLWYNVKFEIKKAVNTQHIISGKIRQSDDLRFILNGLRGVHSFRYKVISEEEIEIY